MVWVIKSESVRNAQGQECRLEVRMEKKWKEILAVFACENNAV